MSAPERWIPSKFMDAFLYTAAAVTYVIFAIYNKWLMNWVLGPLWLVAWVWGLPPARPPATGEPLVLSGRRAGPHGGAA
jgi:hypothetical protein